MADTKDLQALLQNGTAPPQKPEVSAEIARKLAQLNPRLKAGESTSEFIAQAQNVIAGGAGKRPEAKTAEPSPLTNAKDVDHLLDLSAQTFAQEKRELETQLSIIQQRLNGLSAKHLGEVIDRLAELDPNLSSMVTQHALQVHKRHLDTLGFTPAKFIERVRQKRK